MKLVVTSPLVKVSLLLRASKCPEIGHHRPKMNRASSRRGAWSRAPSGPSLNLSLTEGQNRRRGDVTVDSRL